MTSPARPSTAEQQQTAPLQSAGEDAGPAGSDASATARATDVEQAVLAAARAAKDAQPALARLHRARKDEVLLAMADALVEGTDAILQANARDLEAADAAGIDAGLRDRLALDAGRVAAIAEQLRAAEPPIDVVRADLPENRGLTAVLRHGLRLCTHEVIARADADDISYPQRFEAQLPLIRDGADLVGASMNEIGDQEEVLALRQAPTDPARIARISKLRNPVSHPAVVFRRSAVEAVGGYQELPLAEDYWLWVRMMRAGAEVRNVAEPLVGYRVSDGAYSRRGGPQVFAAEMQLQSRLFGLGHVGRLELARNVVVRGGYRFIPRRLRERSFRALVSSRRV